jgi:hypothetical protein
VSWEDTQAVRRLIEPILPGTADGL